MKSLGILIKRLGGGAGSYATERLCNWHKN